MNFGLRCLHFPIIQHFLVSPREPLVQNGMLTLLVIFEFKRTGENEAE